MNLKVFSTAVLAASFLGATASAYQLGDRDYFGQIPHFNGHKPVTTSSRPVVAFPGAGASRDPIYLYVPRKHRISWKNYCHYYDACSVPVFFATQAWYLNQFVPFFNEHRPTPPEMKHNYRPNAPKPHQQAPRHDSKPQQPARPAAQQAHKPAQQPAAKPNNQRPAQPQGAQRPNNNQRQPAPQNNQGQRPGNQPGQQGPRH